MKPDLVGTLQPAELAARASGAGVALRYGSFWGKDLDAPAGVVEAAVAAITSAQAAGRARTLVIEQGKEAAIPMPVRWKLVSAERGEPVAAHGDAGEAVLPASLAAGYYRLLPRDGNSGQDHSAATGAAAGTRDGAGTAFVIVAPARCWTPAAFHQGRRWWGVTVQLYGLRSHTDWGIGDFAGLEKLVEAAAAQGAAFVGLSPLHALFAHRPEGASPYSPSSRLALNPLYIHVPGLPEFAACEAARALAESPAFTARLGALREAGHVRYAEAAAAKDAVLSVIWAQFDAGTLGSPARVAAFRRFMREHSATLGRHALCEAIQLTLHAQDANAWGWPAWPPELHDPDSPAVQAFAQAHAALVRYRFWLQWLAHEQLARAQHKARALMPLGLYCDLAVGAANGGSETWTQRGLHVGGLNIGAPPDPLSLKGQDWGLPPMNPAALAARGFRPFIDLIQFAMRHAGAIRLDHVMALMRLFWTGPDGGTYVDYPLEALLAILAVESHRHRCLVIGEDLGNVAPRMREAMASHEVLSYRPLLFERDGEGNFRKPDAWERRAMAVVTTHDLPTLAGFWRGSDLDLQAEHGFLEGEALAAERQKRAADRARLQQALQGEGLLPQGPRADGPAPDCNDELAAAVHAFIARSPCWLASAQLEDLAGQGEQVNLPGTSEAQRPNWRLRLPVAVEDLPTHKRFRDITAAFARERGRALDARDAEAAEPLPALETADVPLATYRVQFHANATFAAVTQAVGYLHELGISHLYASPYLMARPGSTHGYDVTDPTRLNPEIGTDEDHAELCAELASHGMGQVLDIVPNHMGVLEADNPWWMDVLEHGRASPHARTFDIEWEAPQPELRGRVLLPVLGDQYGRVLEAGDLQLRFDAAQGRFSVHYFNHHVPVDPAMYGQIFEAAPAPGGGLGAPADAFAAVRLLQQGFSALPARDDSQWSDESPRNARLRDAPMLRQKLAALAARSDWMREWIAACLRRLNGEPGKPQSFDALDALIRGQAWRLADWRVAGDDINYRRFFDVNALAAVRMEDEAVFEAMHARVLRWVAEGKVTGLRIDHPDGLSDPAAYFERLQRRHAELARAAGREPRALFLVVEKILADHEPLPPQWRVHGGTGYRFASQVNALFVDDSAEAAFDEAWRAFTGDRASFDDTVRECKRLIIDASLASELNWLTETLHTITRADRRACDYTRNRLRGALMEIATGFPVYRTYVGQGEPSATDRQHIEWAVSQARRRLGTAEAELLAYLRDVLCGLPGPNAGARRDFVRRWQQFTSPVMAKAMEDTAFYRQVRLASLNDVGSEPRRFGMSPAAFHQANVQRAQHRPNWLLATSTHDSKRSEDVRARLNVLSEMPAAWEQAVQRFSAMAAPWRREVDGETAPCAADEWSLYQALVGIWPAQGASGAERPELARRVHGYMRKAAREAKRETNWMAPNEAYEAALDACIDGLLGNHDFIAELERFVGRIAPWGFRNSLAQVALKLTAPGVPDIYHGCERWNFSLVDPDNRRAVDFNALAAGLARIKPLYGEGYPAAAQWKALMPALPDGDAKQLVTWRLLQLRGALPALFRGGIYLPLEVEGPAAEHALAFARIHGGSAVVVVAARLMHRMSPAGWLGTSVRIGAGHPMLARVPAWLEWMDGRRMPGGGEMPDLALDGLLGNACNAGPALPFAVLVHDEAAA